MQITDVKGSFVLHNGIEMPYLGLGVYQSKDGQEVINAIKWAVEAGYRHIDTAMIYRNEKGVGEGVRQCGVNREELFVVSKVWNSDQGYESTLNAYQASLDRLKLDYLDLYLVHWPVEGKFVETWKALESLYKAGKVRAIGVCNFMQHHLESLLPQAEIVPMVNQVEFHPYLVQQSLLDYCKQKNIQVEAWSPIMQGHAPEVAVLQEIGDTYGKSAVQVALRWDLQKGVVTIPKSSNKNRIEANANVFDFELSSEDMARIDALDRHKRFGPDPNNFDF